MRKHLLAAGAALLVAGANPANAEDTTGSSTTTDPATAAANLAKLQADALDAQATAAKDTVAAQQAALDYQRKLIPGSGSTNQISVSAGAGQVEAQLLAQRQLSGLTAQAAQRAAAAIHAACVAVPASCRGSILLITSTQSLAAVNWTIFRTRQGSVGASLDAAIHSYDTQAAKGTPAAPPKPAKSSDYAQLLNIPALASALGTGISAAANLASYMATNTTVGSVSVTPSTDALTADFAGNLRRACPGRPTYIADRTTTITGSDDIAKMLAELDQKAATAATDLANAQQRSTNAKTGTKHDTATPDSDAWDHVAASLTTAIANYTALGSALAENGALPLSKVIADYGVYSLLHNESGAYALLPTYVSAGGGYYTQTNLWSVLGAMPFHVSGGSGVSYLLFDASTGAVIDGGNVEGVQAYMNVTKVAEALGGTTATASSVAC